CEICRPHFDHGGGPQLLIKRWYGLVTEFLSRPPGDRISGYIYTLRSGGSSNWFNVSTSGYFTWGPVALFVVGLVGRGVEDETINRFRVTEISILSLKQDASFRLWIFW
ncbi:hypothetical protein BgiBS90_010892, partial [Biomphalaria glabrata]